MFLKFTRKPTEVQIKGNVNNKDTVNIHEIKSVLAIEDRKAQYFRGRMGTGCGHRGSPTEK